MIVVTCICILFSIMPGFQPYTDNNNKYKINMKSCIQGSLID